MNGNTQSFIEYLIHIGGMILVSIPYFAKVTNECFRAGFSIPLEWNLCEIKT